MNLDEGDVGDENDIKYSCKEINSDADDADEAESRVSFTIQRYGCLFFYCHILLRRKEPAILKPSCKIARRKTH